MNITDGKCPRCQRVMTCDPASGTCWCQELKPISTAVKIQLQAQHPGRCLCKSCLNEISEETDTRVTTSSQVL